MQTAVFIPFATLVLPRTHTFIHSDSAMVQVTYNGCLSLDDVEITKQTNMDALVSQAARILRKGKYDHHTANITITSGWFREAAHSSHSHASATDMTAIQADFLEEGKPALHLPLGRVVHVASMIEGSLKKANLVNILSLNEGSSRLSLKPQFAWLVHMGCATYITKQTINRSIHQAIYLSI